jgi:diguanylate cyclase (GGDEF)-like protein/PAS domain S-box-containing protein
MFELFFVAAVCIVLTVVVVLSWQKLSEKSDSGDKTPGSEDKAPDAENNPLEFLIESTFGSTGDTFFYSLARELAQFLSIDSVLLASCEDREQGIYSTLAYWCDGSYIMNQIISVLNSPCEDINGLCYLETSASELYPEAALLNTQFKVDGFFAIRLLDSSGNPVGLLAGMNRSALLMGKEKLDIIKHFSARAAAELERNLAANDVLHAKEKAQVTLHSIGDAVITTDSVGCIDYMNPVAETLTGWRFHQVMGMSLEAVLHLEDDVTGEVIPDPALRCLSEKRIVAPKSDNVLVARNGERYSIQGSAGPMLDAKGDCIGVVLVFKDVTDSHRLQKLMVHKATHDPLTGLVNRSEFEQRLKKALQSTKEYENTHALLYLDLDQFKVVNDAAGHVAGDELLKQICTLLANQLRGRDTLGRLGGDEFSVLLENCPLSKASKVAQILIDVIREYRFVWDDKTYQVGVSIGIVPITAESTSTAELMTHADQACYCAKDLGRGRAHVYDAKDAELAKQHGEILQISDLREALAREQFQLLYQPIISLDAAQSGMGTHAEVLLRMLDQAGNYILPGSFLPAADRFGLMQAIDRWVIGKVFKDYAHLFMQNPHLLLSLNLSANSIADDSLADYIVRMFDKSVVLPHQICFEVNETVVTNNLSNMGQLIDRLGGMGCKFALDNFGSGLSSFSFIKNLKIDYIKIDGNLVRDISEDAIDRAMVESINTMGHLLGIRTIAECADSESSIQALKSLGIDYAQGFYLGNPVSMDEFGGAKATLSRNSRAPVN